MDPNAALDLLRAALDADNTDDATLHAENLRDWCARGGFAPSFGPGRFEGCAWYVLYADHWTMLGDGEQVAEYEDTSLVLHALSAEDRALFGFDSDAAYLVHEISSQGFHDAYTCTEDDAERARNFEVSEEID